MAVREITEITTKLYQREERSLMVLCTLVFMIQNAPTLMHQADLSLSTKDKAAMMEHLLTLPTSELKRIIECDKAPSFVSSCAKMLRRDELLEYMQILSILHK